MESGVESRMGMCLEVLRWGQAVDALIESEQLAL